MEELMYELFRAIYDCNTAKPPKFVIIGNGDITKAFYNGRNITEEVEAICYTHDANAGDGAVLTTYKSETMEYK